MKHILFCITAALLAFACGPVPETYTKCVTVEDGGTYAQPHGGEFAKVATAWLDWQLKDDVKGAQMFMGCPCGLDFREGWQHELNDLEQ